MKISGWIALIVVAIIAIGGWFTPVGQAAFGALADSTNFTNLGAKVLKVGTGCDDSSTWTACQGASVGATGTFSQGGGVNSLSIASTTALTASDFDTENAIELTLTDGTGTIALPASSTFPLGTNPGSMREFTIFNASSTINITMSGGTGTLLEKASSTAIISGSGAALFTAWRKANSDIEVLMVQGQ